MSTTARQTLVLVKTDPSIGPAPVGERYACQLPADLSRHRAVLRASLLFARDRPDEDHTCWELEDDQTADGPSNEGGAP